MALAYRLERWLLMQHAPSVVRLVLLQNDDFSAIKRLRQECGEVTPLHTPVAEFIRYRIAVCDAKSKFCDAKLNVIRRKLRCKAILTAQK